MRVAVVGAGAMGRRHVRVFVAHAAFEVTAVFDVDSAACRRAAADFDVAAVDREEEAFARADLVVFATPIAEHAAGATRALAANKHVFVEKPMCSHPREAEEMLDLARRSGVGLFVGHSERFNPAVVELLRRVDASDVISLAAVRQGPPATGCLSARAQDADVVLNLGVHDIDLAALFTGAKVGVTEASGNRTRARLTLETAGGASATLEVDRFAKTRRRRLTLTTSREIYEADLLAPHLAVAPREHPSETTGLPLARLEPLALQATALRAALDRRPSAIATGEDGAHAVTVALEAARLIGAPARTAAPRRPLESGSWEAAPPSHQS